MGDYKALTARLTYLAEPGDPVSVSVLFGAFRGWGVARRQRALYEAAQRGLIELDHYTSMQLLDRRCWLTRAGLG